MIKYKQIKEYVVFHQTGGETVEKRIALLGGGKWLAGSFAYDSAKKLARRLAEQEITVMNGGIDAGVMQASYWGVKDVSGSFLAVLFPTIKRFAIPGLRDDEFAMKRNGEDRLRVLTDSRIIRVFFQGDGGTSDELVHAARKNELHKKLGLKGEPAPIFVVYPTATQFFPIRQALFALGIDRMVVDSIAVCTSPEEAAGYILQ